jgi:transposase
LKLDTSQHLLALSRAEANGRKRLRLLAISHFLEGKNRTQIALNLKVSRRSINTWVSNYLSDGVVGLEAKKLQDAFALYR